ncbi:MAG: MFS transporter [Desulfurococcaceae archaeon]
MRETLKEYISELRGLLAGNVGVMAISWLLFSLTGGLVSPFFAKYAKDLGASDMDIAYIRSIGMLALALSLIPGSLLTDYIGRARTIIIGTACVTIAQFLYVVVPDWRAFLYVYVFDQASHFYQPALTAIVMDSVPRGKEFKGFLALNVVTSIPSLFMPFIGGVLYEKYNATGLRVGFLANGFTALAVLILRIKALRETYTARDKELSSLVLELAGYRPLLVKTLELYVYTSILLQVAVGVSSTYGAIYAMDVLGVSKPMWGVISSVGMLGGVMSSLLLLRFKRTNAVSMAVLGSLGIVSSAVLFALPYFTGSLVLEILVASSLIGAVSSSMHGSAISALLTRMLPVEVRGRAIGIQRILDNIGASIASLVAGLLYTTLGPGVALLVSSLIGLLSTVYLYILVKHSS